MKLFLKIFGVIFGVFTLLPLVLFHLFNLLKSTTFAFIILSLLSLISSIIIYIIFQQIQEKIGTCEIEVSNYKTETVTLSRMAGIAENSTGVLHNIGNILNSINIAASLVAEKYNNLRVSGLVKAAKLIKSHQSDITSFLTKDPKGKLLPEYLQKVAQEISEDQDIICSELTGLTKNIEHIKEIVSVQQSYSRKNGNIEKVTLKDAIDDALRMNINNIDRNKIIVNKQYNSEAFIEIEKNKLLQILINLVQNACQALRDSTAPEKTMFIELEEENKIAIIRITDNGIGINHDNLSRIFKHGFTTKKNGNGFGLHCSRFLAEEMDGSLDSFSDGEDKGATFTLRIPVPNFNLN